MPGGGLGSVDLAELAVELCPEPLGQVLVDTAAASAGSSRNTAPALTNASRSAWRMRMRRPTRTAGSEPWSIHYLDFRVMPTAIVENLLHTVASLSDST